MSRRKSTFLQLWGGRCYLANLELLSTGGPISNFFPSVSTNADEKYVLGTFRARCLHLETCLRCWEDAARVTSGSARPSKQTRQPPKGEGEEEFKGDEVKGKQFS